MSKAQNYLYDIIKQPSVNIDTIIDADWKTSIFMKTTSVSISLINYSTWAFISGYTIHKALFNIKIKVVVSIRSIHAAILVVTFVSFCVIH